jgi:hypothetical protein
MDEIICSQCLPEDDGSTTSFEGTEEEALAEGWVDTENGLVCPNCAASNIDDSFNTAGELKDVVEELERLNNENQ